MDPGIIKAPNACIIPPMAETARYHVLRRIAHGGMAEIFLALQLGVEGFQKQVVLKRILPALAADPSFVQMLLDEAHIASTLNHSNLVQVLDLRHSGSEYFLVLEFVDGWSLEQVRRRAQKARLKLPLPLALYIAGCLCRALAYVHGRTRDGRPAGIVHRDVNPQNVLLSAEGEVKLADFGIAKALGKRQKTATGIIKGKFAYMSPEQAAGEDLDHRSDLFSVGTLLYLLTTGKKPFDGNSDLDVIIQVRKARYAKPSSFVRDFNPDVERLIARALRANRLTRWQTAEQMADRIDVIVNKLGQPTGPTALKRWLESLTARDGIKSAAHTGEEIAAPTAPDNTIQVGTRDLELEVVTGDGVSDEAPRVTPARGTATTRVVYAAPTVLASDLAARLAARSRPPGTTEPSAPSWGEREPSRSTTRQSTQTTLDPVAPSWASSPAGTAPEADAGENPTSQPEPSGDASEPSAAVSTSTEAEPAPGAVNPAWTAGDSRALRSTKEGTLPAWATGDLEPPRHGRFGRWLRRMVIRTFVLAVLVAGAGYFARPYLPPRVVLPVEAWVRALPQRINALAHRRHLPPEVPAAR